MPKFYMPKYWHDKCLLTHSFPMHPFSTSRKHQKTVRFFDVFKGKWKGALGTNGLTENVVHGEIILNPSPAISLESIARDK